MVKTISYILLYIFIYLIVTFNQSNAENISYNNITIDKRHIEKLSDRDSIIFSAIINEYTEYGIRLVSMMVQLIDVPYRYGGITINGMDCSAFTKTVFSSVEFELPRTAAEQSELGEYISKDSLQFGDLLFFHRGKYITHVGIYLENGYFIHASSKNRKICIQNLDSEYYDHFFAFAKRVNT